MSGIQNTLSHHLKRQFSPSFRYIILVLLVIVNLNVQALPSGNWPSERWETISSDNAEFSQEGITSAENFIHKNLPAIRSFLIVQNGRLVFEKYYNGAIAIQSHRVASVTKSITSVLTGIAIDNGELAGIHLTAAQLFPEYISKVKDPRTADITLHQLLNMTGGFKWVDRSQDFWNWRYSRDRLKRSINLPLSQAPGTIFNYVTPSSQLIGSAVSRATGQSLQDYANQHLFRPMSEEIKSWDKDPAGFNTGGTGLSLTPRQMAKFGLLMLNEGRWKNEQIVSRSWVQSATQNQIPAAAGMGYGYQFWIRNMGSCRGYMAWGRGGQFIVVIPDQNLVIVVTSQSRVDGPGTAHYHPLFDIVSNATSAAKKCSPDPELNQLTKNSHRQISLNTPKELAAFFSRYQAAITGNNTESLAKLYSDHYYADGANKAERVNSLKLLLGKIKTFDIFTEDFEILPNGISYRIYVRSNIGSFTATNFIAQESKQWVLLGNPKGQPRDNTAPEEVQHLLKSHIAAVQSGRVKLFADNFSENYLTNGLTKSDLVAYMTPFLPDIKPAKIVISEFVRQGNKATINGVFITKGFGHLPLRPLYQSIVFKEGKWRWHGNQQSE